MTVSHRFHVERACTYDEKGNITQWSRETLGGARTITAARRDQRALKREAPSFHRGWRIVCVTTTTHVVEISKRRGMP